MVQFAVPWCQMFTLVRQERVHAMSMSQFNVWDTTHYVLFPGVFLHYQPFPHLSTLIRVEGLEEASL